MNAREGTVSHDVWQVSNLTLGLEVCVLVQRHSINFYKNCAFCDRSMKFGMHVDLAILNTFRYGATCNTF